MHVTLSFTEWLKVAAALIVGNAVGILVPVFVIDWWRDRQFDQRLNRRR